MLAKFKALHEDRENGFTLIELLVVILIIGILAAIAIPVFLNQRQTANDSAVKSDVRNAITQVETWIASKSSEAVTIQTAEITSMDIKESPGVSLLIRGNSNNYCIFGVHSNGKKYSSSYYTYDSSKGSPGETSSHCSIANNSVGPDGNTQGTRGV